MSETTPMSEWLQGAQGLFVGYIGVVNGLFEALARRGPLTPGALAEEAGCDGGYLTRWCEAAYAFGYLEDAAGGAFGLSALGESMRPAGAGTGMPFAVQAVLGAHIAERAAGLARSGERPGEGVLVERETLLPWFGPMLEARYAPFFETQILPALGVYAEVDRRGGMAVDLGCGNGWYLRALARHYPRLRGVGVDALETPIREAARRARAEGAGERLSFRRGDVYELDLDEPADLIAMNRALHHLWSDKERVFALLREHLAPGGAAVVWEPAWPDERAVLRAPEYRGMAFHNLAEHVQGNRFLRPGEIEAELAKAGLSPRVHRFAEGREVVVTGTRPA